jgi:hypothetical protein
MTPRLSVNEGKVAEEQQEQLDYRDSEGDDVYDLIDEIWMNFQNYFSVGTECVFYFR